MKQPKPYHVKVENLNATNYGTFGTDLEPCYRLSDQELERWAADPDCIEKDACADALAQRRAKREVATQAARDAEEKRLSQKRQTLQDNPFDPRTEISADARHIASRIVTHLWILFVLLPIILGLLYALFK